MINNYSLRKNMKKKQPIGNKLLIVRVPIEKFNSIQFNNLSYIQ